MESKLDVLHVTLWATDPTEHAEWHPGINPTFFDKRTEGLKLVTQAKRQLGTRVPLISKCPFTEATSGTSTNGSNWLWPAGATR